MVNLLSASNALVIRLGYLQKLFRIASLNIYEQIVNYVTEVIQFHSKKFATNTDKFIRSPNASMLKTNLTMDSVDNKTNQTPIKSIFSKLFL